MNKRKVPKIRFKGFYDDWEQRKLGDIIEFLDTLRKPLKETDRESGPYPYYGASGIVDYVADYIFDEELILLSEDGANITDRNYPICFLAAGKYWVNNHAHVLKARNKMDNYFICMSMERKDYSNYNTGMAMPKLNKDTCCQIPVDCPVFEEQKKIGDYFRKLDSLITLHQRKLELLKRLKNSLINRCFTGEKITMSKLILYHGSPNRVIVPKFGYGEDRHDYGRGFYLTENLELAKEWAVCRPDETNGWVHKYELEMDGLNILDFQKYDVLSWLAELMKHRDAADSKRYKMLAQKFIEKYGIDTCGYDVITGWRANASYFYIAKEFVRDNIDIEILEELLSLGGLGIQFCIKSERAFAQLSEVEQDIMSVDYSEFNDRYNERDINARNKMRALVDSDANKVTHVFSTLFER